MLDMETMRRAYTELSGMNNQLVQSYNTRAQNHDTLLTALKEVNQMIQKSANLRMGKSKSRVISDCRNAVKNNNMQSLFRILKHGYEPSSMSAAQIAQSK
jgi:Bardet-Biedl syndrome 2 protein